MSCLNCGKPTPNETYICESCLIESHLKDHFAESLVVYPSLLNDLEFGESMLIKVGEPRKTESLRLIQEDHAKPAIPTYFSFKTQDLSESTARMFLLDFKQTLLNMGFAVDLEKKPLLLLTTGDMALSRHVLTKVKEIESRFSNLLDIEIVILIGNFHYSLFRANSGTITIGDRKYHLEKALEYYDRALTMNPDLVVTWKNKARVLLDQNDTKGAIQCFDWIQKNQKPGESDVFVLLYKGLALIRSEKFDEALKCFDSVLERDPNNVEAWRNKGEVFSRTNRWGGAIQCFSEAVKHAPHREDIWISMSETYVNHSKFKDASRCLDEVLKINIWNSDAWFLQGIVFSKIDRWGAAVQCLDKSIAINPINIRAWRARGDLFLNTGRYEEALSCFEKGLLIQPKNTSLLLSEVRALKSLGRFDEAVNTLKIIESQDGKNANMLFEMGDVLQETGKAYKALKSFDAALELKPDFTEAFFKKGQTLEKLRRYKEAISCYEKVLGLDPKHQAAQVALKDCMMKMDGK